MCFLARGLYHIFRSLSVSLSSPPQENILLKQPGDNSQVKIIDFGMAAFRGDPVEAVGTPEFMAPEIVELTSESVRRLRVDPAVDMWAIGIITYFLLTGRTPFEGDGRGTTEEEVDRILMRVSTGKWTFAPPQFRTTSDAAKDFIRSLLRVRPEERLTVREALASPWITQGMANPGAHGGIYSSRRLAFKDQRPLRLSAARAAVPPGINEMLKAGAKPPLHKMAAAAANSGQPPYAMAAHQAGAGLPAWMYNKDGQVAMPRAPLDAPGAGAGAGVGGGGGGAGAATAYGRGGGQGRPVEQPPWWQGTTFKTVVVLFVVHQLAGLLAGGGSQAAERRREEERRARGRGGGRGPPRRPPPQARGICAGIGSFSFCFLSFPVLRRARRTREEPAIARTSPPPRPLSPSLSSFPSCPLDQLAARRVAEQVAQAVAESARRGGGGRGGSQEQDEWGRDTVRPRGQLGGGALSPPPPLLPEELEDGAKRGRGCLGEKKNGGIRRWPASPFLLGSPATSCPASRVSAASSLPPVPPPLPHVLGRPKQLSNSQVMERTSRMLSRALTRAEESQIELARASSQVYPACQPLLSFSSSRVGSERKCLLRGRGREGA